MVSRIMDMIGIKGYFTIHSFRATTAAHLYEQNVDKQLIVEITGHESDTVHRYKRTSIAMKESIK